MKRLSPRSLSESIRVSRRYAILTFRGCLLLAYFIILPMLLALLFHWAFYAVASASLYREAWTSPTLLLFATFAGGVLNRWKMDREGGTLSLFVLGIIGFIGFAVLTDYDLQQGGSLYLRFLPVFPGRGLHPYILMTPVIGILGMLIHVFKAKGE